MIFRCIPISKKQDGCSSKEQPSQSVKEPLISRAARRSRQRVLGLSAKKSTIFSDGAFLERATRLELASRHPTNGNGHSREPCLTSYDFTRCAQVEAASSRGCLQKKKAPSSQMVLFWSGRRGSNSLPRPWQGRALPDELRPQTAPLLRHLGASGRSRTNDTRIFSPLLYQLSYRGIWRPRRGSNPRPPA